MRLKYVLPFILLLLVGCQNEHALFFELPEEAVISLEQHEEFAKDIRIIGQHAYNSETYYYVFEGTTSTQKEWFVADVKKDSKENKWYVETAINIAVDESGSSGTGNYTASVVRKNEMAQDDELIVQTTDATYNVLVELEAK